MDVSSLQPDRPFIFNEGGTTNINKATTVKSIVIGNSIATQNPELFDVSARNYVPGEMNASALKTNAYVKRILVQ